MAARRKNGAMGAKRKQLEESSDDEESQSGIPIEDDEDDKPLLRFCPSPEEAPVAKTTFPSEGDNRRRLENGAVGRPIC